MAAALRTLLIYDGECAFCRWGMHVVRRLDRGGVFGFCPYGTPTAESILSRLPAERRYTSHHAFRDGVLHSATDAARVTLEGLPLGRIAVALQAHRLYPLIARNRAVLGRLVPHRSLLDTCSQPRTRV
ncbi:MAG: thiol-disulfide oxidoreductase DCC family protein [Actinomycetota bacterium]